MKTIRLEGNALEALAGPLDETLRLIEDRFPGRERRERVPVPDGLLKESLPGRENYFQEERRLFYVAMTRARRALFLTWAREYPSDPRYMRAAQAALAEASRLTAIPGVAVEA